MVTPDRALLLMCGTRALDLSQSRVMGILNVTPDSFSDGGRFNRLDDALRHAESMYKAGASLIDVGGESTRPGAPAVSEQQELDRVLPVVERIHAELDVVISLDTSSPQVMREGAAAGAGLINDVRALERPGALAAAAFTGLPVCLMHMRGEPSTMQGLAGYQDVVGEVLDYLLARVACCEAAGIARECLLLDPGIGFAKNLEHNLELLRRLDALDALGFPVLLGISRKRMIAEALGGREVHERLCGGLGVLAWAHAQGVRLFRVHDVRESLDMLRMLDILAKGLG